MEKILRLNLQFFAEGDPDPTPEETPAEPAPGEELITLTQAEFDRKIGERLAREKAKAEKAVEDAKAEAERERLEKEAEYKTLYEQSQARIAEIEAQAKASELSAKKQALLIEAGYPADKLADVTDYIMGEDEESLKASIERFKVVAPPVKAYVDPQSGAGNRKQPDQKDGTEIGKEMYERIKHRLV